MSTCRVTVYDRPRIHPGGRSGSRYSACGLPVYKYGLCRMHYERRVELGGKP